MLTKRLQVLLDAERYERLKRASQRQGAPIGELVRRAIDRQYPAEGEALSRAEAAQSLLASEAPPGTEPEWAEQKEALLDELAGSATRD